MANIPLQSISFPGLADKYTTPVVDNTLTQAGAAADAKKTGDEIGAIKNDLSEKADKTDAYSAYIVETETGSIASFSDGADDVPVKDLTVAIEPVQSGSGDPSPTNVRPISGWTGANVTRTGKNFIPNIPSSFTSGTVLVDFGKDIKFDGFCFSMLFSGSFVNAGASLIDGKDSADNNVISITPQALKKVSDDTALTANTVYTNERVYAYVSRTFYVSKLLIFNYPAFTAPSFAECQFEEGTRTAYEPYQGETYEVNWTTEAGTVYGGTLDVTTGVLTVDRALWTKNTSAMNNDENFPGWRNSGIKDIVGSGINANFTNQTLNVGTKYSVNTQSGDILFLPMNGYNKTQAEWQALALDVQIAAELATPQTYQLTPQEVKTVLGQNNIFADTGNVTVHYRADTKLYIDKALNT